MGGDFNNVLSMNYKYISIPSDNSFDRSTPIYGVKVDFDGAGGAFSEDYFAYNFDLAAPASSSNFYQRDDEGGNFVIKVWSQNVKNNNNSAEVKDNNDVCTFFEGDTQVSSVFNSVGTNIYEISFCQPLYLRNIGYFNSTIDESRARGRIELLVEDPSTIYATPSKTVLAATGETITIDIETENAWTATEPVFFTLSQTAGTGNATITLTAPANTGATYRSGTVVVTDSATGDYVIVTIRQKYPTNGQPVYLGGNDVTELYLGGNAVSEAYLGDVLVFSSGPFVGLKMSPKTMKFMDKAISTGDTFELSVKSSENWTLTTDADWFTLSPTTGLGTSEKTIITLTVTSKPSAETTNTITCTSANYSASTSTLYKIGYGIPANEIWYATTDNSIITSINNWRVYDKSNVQMDRYDVDYTTYGKWVFPRDIGYVAGDPNQTTNGWLNLTELGLPEMDPSMCIGTNDFGLRYINQPLTAWTRVYGDYEYINDEETMAWGSDGCGGIISRGNSGTLTIPEGVKALGPYGLNRSKWEHIIFPTTFVGGVSSYNDGNAGGQYCFENMSDLQSVKYQTLAAPPMYNNCWNYIRQSGIVYYPDGGTGYGPYHRPDYFTFQTYTP